MQNGNPSRELYAPAGNARYGAPKNYGGAPNLYSQAPINRHTRSRPNLCALFFPPVIIFLGVFAALAFELHWESAAAAYLICVVALVIVLVVCFYSYDAYLKRGTAQPEIRFFPVVLGSAMLLAWVLAVILGSVCYSLYSDHYYTLATLNTYTNVDPSTSSGEGYMDAGTISFSSNASLDTSYAMAYVSSTTYCIAPVTVSGSSMLNYDFWAVDTDCCSKGGTDYACENYDDSDADGGIRLMDDTASGYYTLALKQAEASYSISSSHPIFIYWMESPATVVSDYISSAYTFTLYACIGFIIFMLIVLIVAWCCFGGGKKAMGI